MNSPREPVKRVSLVYILVGLGLAGVLVGTVLLVRSNKPKFSEAAASFARTKGPLGAPVQLIEYSDFQCPACRTAHLLLAELLAAHKDKIRLTFQHFPLAGHPWATLAHHAAECAAEQNSFWVYHDRLYEKQSVWSVSLQAPLEAFMSYAKEDGLDLDLFARCLSDPRADEKIHEEKLSGEGLGVRSTPTFFLNGKVVVGTATLREEIEKLIQ